MGGYGVTVFGFDGIRDNASFENAMDYGNGIDNVLVNDEPAFSVGTRHPSHAGQMLPPN